MELVKISTTVELEVVRPLLLNPAHHMYRTAFKVEPEPLAKYEFENLVDAFEDGRVAMLVESDMLIAIAAVKEHRWESERYGFPMGKVSSFLVAADVTEPELACLRLLRWITGTAAPELGLQHLLCRATAEDIPLIHSLEEVGFQHMTTMMQLFWSRPPKTMPEIPEGWQVRETREEDRPLLESISRDTLSNIVTRFSADPHLPAARTQSLYQAWATASVDGSFADINFAIVRSDQPAQEGNIDGFISARFNPDLGKLLDLRFGEYTIGGVNPDSRKGGAFHAGVRAIARWFWEHDADVVVAYTQAHNYGSLRALIAAGARPVETHHCFHYWLGK